MVKNLVARLFYQKFRYGLQLPPLKLLNKSRKEADLYAAGKIDAFVPRGRAFPSGVSVIFHQFVFFLDPGPNAVSTVGDTSQWGGKNAPVGRVSYIFGGDVKVDFFIIRLQVD